MNGQMELGTQPLVVPINIQYASALCFSIDIHCHLGVEGSVIFMEFISSTFLVDFGYMGAGKRIL